MRRVRRIAVPATIALVLAAGVVLLLLAHDVRVWHGTIDRATAQTTRHPASPWPTSAGTVLPRFASADLLSVERDRSWLGAIQLFSYAYEQTERLDTLGVSGYELLLDGQARLRPLTQDPDPARASQAFDLLAVLVFRQAYPGSGVDASLVGDGVIDLQNAVRLDPQNELAKENLELALRVASATHNVVRKASSTGNARTSRRKGGYGTPPGVGY
ncbi:MAG TPA: hypothetical protein VHC01_13495 [Gaiellaceae bacterium]|jgi:hypothetical protein|nr:hypothetical protein [Gaiellaceae bacterium]